MPQTKNMSELDENIEQTPEQEANALVEHSPEAIVASVIEDYELDPNIDSDLIKKISEERLRNGKNFATVLRQKRSWREKAISAAPADKKPEVKTTKKESFTPEDIEELLERKISAKLAEKDLSALDFSNEIKEEIKSYSTLKGISIEEAAKSEYITFIARKQTEKARIDDASISSKSNKPGLSKNFDKMSPSDFDLTTEEGRKSWQEFKKHLKSSE